MAHASTTRAEPMKRTVGFALDGEELPPPNDVRLGGSPSPVIIPPVLQVGSRLCTNEFNFNFSPKIYLRLCIRVGVCPSSACIRLYILHRA
eukprot:5141432-Pyramimonas_sp.AAC.2